jgi:hypothetical protein
VRITGNEIIFIAGTQSQENFKLMELHQQPGIVKLLHCVVGAGNFKIKNQTLINNKGSNKALFL